MQSWLIKQIAFITFISMCATALRLLCVECGVTLSRQDIVVNSKGQPLQRHTHD